MALSPVCFSGEASRQSNQRPTQRPCYQQRASQCTACVHSQASTCGTRERIGKDRRAQSTSRSSVQTCRSRYLCLFQVDRSASRDANRTKRWRCLLDGDTNCSCRVSTNGLGHSSFASCHEDQRVVPDRIWNRGRFRQHATCRQSCKLVNVVRLLKSFSDRPIQLVHGEAQDKPRTGVVTQTAFVLGRNMPSLAQRFKLICARRRFIVDVVVSARRVN